MNMIRSDTYRIFKSIGLQLYTFLIIITYLISILFREAGGIVFSTNASVITTTGAYKLDIQMVGMNASFYFFFIIPISVIILSDFSTGAVKNSIASTVSRTKYYVMKFAYSLGFVLISFLSANILFWVTNRCINGSEYASALGDFIKPVINQLPICAAVAAVFILLAFILRKAALYNAITIALPIAQMLLVSLLLGADLDKAVEFLDKVNYNNVFLYLVDPSTDYLIKTIISCVSVIIVCFITGLQVFRKSEI